MMNDIEIKISKSGHPVPVVNTIHLHSIYNPEREAEGFVKNSEKKIENNSKVLIFGLGFGYHIEALEKRLKHLYKDSYEVVVIEPCRELYKKWKEAKVTSFSTRVRVVSYDIIQKYYDDSLLTEFMVKKPKIITHLASFQLHETFFRGFMSFSYPSDTISSSSFVQDDGLSSFLMSNDSGSTEELLEKINNSNSMKEWEFFTLALGEIVKR